MSTFLLSQKIKLALETLQYMDKKIKFSKMNSSEKKK
jgi:hypothetical protein